MNVLLCVTNGPPPARLLSELERQGHLVRAATDARTTLDQIRRDPPDIAVLSFDLLKDDFEEVLKAVLSADDLYRSLIVLLGHDTPDRRAELYAAGVDEVAGPSLTSHELASRIKSAERIVRLERRLRERVFELESALSRLELNALRRGQAVATASAREPSAEGTPFLLSPAWNAIEDLVGAMCTDYLQSPFQLVAGAVLPAAGIAGAGVTLTDVDHELRIDLTLFVPPGSARVIAEAFCGDPSIVDDTVINDVVLELANSGMGAIRSAFLKDGFRFAGSTPKAAVHRGGAALLRDAEARRVLTYRSEHSLVHAVVCVRRTPRVRIKGIDLREGMVVARDVTNEAGVLVVSAGTRLTETTAMRIARLLPKQMIELADPAGAEDSAPPQSRSAE